MVTDIKLEEESVVLEGRRVDVKARILALDPGGLIHFDLRMPEGGGGGGFGVPPVNPELFEDMFGVLQEESDRTSLALEIRRLRRAVLDLNERLKRLEPTG